jgi:hypothetical protein
MKNSKKPFGGDKKVGHSLLSKPENSLKNWVVPKILDRIETYHLTLGIFAVFGYTYPPGFSFFFFTADTTSFIV